MGLSIYKAAHKGLIGWSQEEMDEAFEHLISDDFVCQMPNYEGWTTLEVELEDLNYEGERDDVIERMIEIKLINKEDARALYLDTGIKQIMFVI